MCTDDYGQQRTETDNTDDRPAGVQNKPYLHKPRNCPTTGWGGWCAVIGLIGLIRLIGQPLWYALPVRERDNQPIIHYLTPVGRQPNDRRPCQRSRGVIQPPTGGTTHYLTPVGRQPNDRRPCQRSRGDIAPQGSREQASPASYFKDLVTRRAQIQPAMPAQMSETKRA